MSLTATLMSQGVATDFSLAPGEAKGVYGPSGCGKSTLLLGLAGLTLLPETSVWVDDKEVTGMAGGERVRHISMMFQNPDSQFCMETVEEELLFCLENIQIEPDLMVEKVMAALRFCEIEALAKRKIVTLSGGEKQLVALACCVALESRYLLLDEPFANLDFAAAQRLSLKLQKLQQKQVGLLIVDHQTSHWQWLSEWLLLEEGTWLTTAELTTLEQIRQAALPLPEPLQPATPQLIFDGYRLPLPTGELRLDLSFRKGDLIGLYAPSGFGKTSLLKSILQLRTYQGSILLAGQRLKKRNIFRNISWIMQNPQDQFVMTTVTAELGTTTGLKELGLWEARDRSPFQLSQGQQRRLAVASFLQREVALLLCDEPTYGQDLENAWRIMTLLHQKAQQGTTVLVVSHDLALLNVFASQLVDLTNYREEASHADSQPHRQVWRDPIERVSRLFSK